MKNRQSHLINKTVEFLKFASTLGLLCFLLVKAPGQAEKVVVLASGFILGGSKLREKFGF